DARRNYPRRRGLSASESYQAAFLLLPARLGEKAPYASLGINSFFAREGYCQGGFPEGTFHALKAEERPLPGRSAPMACFIQDSRRGASALASKPIHSSLDSLDDG